MIVFLIGAVLAGYALLTLWSRQAARDSSTTTPIDWPEALFVTAVSLVVLVGWVGVILVSLGQFSLTGIGIGIGSATAALLVRRRDLRKPAFRSVGRHEVLLGILLLGCSIVFFRPHEFVLGGSDAGTYMGMAATMSKTGGLLIDDEWTRFLSEYSEVTLRQQPAQSLTRHLQFVGWYIDDADSSRLIPQFFPLHPTMIAVGVSLAGLYGGLLVTPVWGVLDIAAVYFVSRKLFGPGIGLLAATLLAVTPTQIYFARSPTTEPLTLLLVFSGLLAYQHLQDEQRASAVWGIFGGAAFGAAFLTRIDMLPVAILIGLALFVRRMAGHWHRGWAIFAVTFALFLAHSLFHALFLAWPYVWNTYSSVVRILTHSALAVVASLLGGAIIVVGGIVLMRGRMQLANSGLGHFVRSSRFRWLLVTCVVGLSAFAYFLRPILEPVRYATSWPGGVQFPILDSQNWVRLGWYLTPLGLLLATLGLARILRRESLRRLDLFLAVGVATTIQYVYNVFNTPYHIYTMRRYVPIVIPVLVIYAAVAIAALVRWRSARIGRAAGGLLALSLLAGLIYQSRYVLPQRELYGAVEQMTALNAHLKPNAIVVISEPAEAVYADIFGAPLRFLFGHDVATIRRDDASVMPFLEALITYAAAHHRPVQLLALAPVAPAVRNALHLQPVEMFPITLRVLMSTFYDYPSVIQTAYYGFDIYDVVGWRPAAENVPAGPVYIDVGTLDTTFIRTGFYDKELVTGAPTMRWTSGEAALDVPLPGGATITIELRAMTFRPASLPSAEVIVQLDGQVIGRFVPTDTWQTFSFLAQTKSDGGVSSLEFTTSTFNPADLQLNNDTRDLGFLMDWIKVTFQ